jgi:hypothetical protein
VTQEQDLLKPEMASQLPRTSLTEQLGKKQDQGRLLTFKLKAPSIDLPSRARSNFFGSSYFRFGTNFCAKRIITWETNSGYGT